jgi:multidrug efflux pump subunit AcrA (membrane-fusion protein)
MNSPQRSSRPSDLPPDAKETELFPVRPPPWAARSLGLVIIIIFALAAGAAVTVRIPQAIRCPFILVPASDPESVSSPVRGVVARVYMEEGKWVEKGAPLYLIQAVIGKGALGKETGTSYGNFVLLTSPSSGVVRGLAPKTSGEMVEHGQEVCQILLTDGKLRAELSVPEDAIAKIQIAQPVKLLLNAFPYQRYGAKQGTIQWVSPAPSSTAEKTTFRVFVQLKDNSFNIGKVAHPLRAGMRGEAQIILDRLLLIEYFFEPLRQIKETMKEVTSS